MTTSMILLGLPRSINDVQRATHHIDTEIDNSLSLSSCRDLFTADADIMIVEEFHSKFLKRLLQELSVYMSQGEKVIFQRKWNADLDYFGVVKIVQSHFEGLFERIFTDGKEKSHLTLKRTSKPLPEFADPTITGFSICVLTSLGDESYFKKLVSSIQLAKCATNLPTELIILDTSGNTLKYAFLADAKILTPANMTSDSAFGAKKNLLAREAKYSEIVMLHDRFTLSEDFFTEYARGSVRYAMSAPRVSLPDGSRGLDWAVVNSSNLALSVGGILDYRDCSEYVYIPGGAILVRKAAWELQPWSELLGWNEHEDVEMSFRYRDRGMLLGLNAATVITSKDRWIAENYRVRFSTYQNILPGPNRGEFNTLLEQ